MKRFVDNDPYCLRPLIATGSTDEQLWASFAEKYLETSGSIIGADQECWHLPMTSSLKSRK